MRRDTRSIFLERKSYRRRRVMDAVRLTAVLGVILWMFPVTWPSGSADDAEGLPMSHALFFVFGVWILLILIAAGLFIMMPSVHRGDDAEDQEEEKGP